MADRKEDRNMTIDKIAPAPRMNADGAPYWAAAAEDRLVVKRCRSCAHVHFPPRHLCPECWSEDLEWIQSGGHGTVYSLTIMHRAPTPEFAGLVPYAVALVDLDEGPRMMANIVGAGALDTCIGMRVVVEFEARAGGTKVPQFRTVPGQVLTA
jgi:uncharacterized protein